MMGIRHATAAVAVLAASAILTPGPACAETAERFYRGKTVTLQIGYGPGGGYDLYARQLARFYGRHIPGEPAIVTQNVPGAGSL